MVTVTSRLSSEEGIIQRPKKVASECGNLKLSADSPWEEFQVKVFLFVCLIVLFCFPKDESVRTLAHWLGVSRVHCLMLFLPLLLWCFASTETVWLINPFTAPACKTSGLKDARTRLQIVHFPVL